MKEFFIINLKISGILVFLHFYFIYSTIEFFYAYLYWKKTYFILFLYLFIVYNKWKIKDKVIL